MDALSSGAAKVDYCQAVLDAGSGAGGSGTALHMAVVIARHGDRTPANVLPHEGDIVWQGCGAGRTDSVPPSSAPLPHVFSGFSYSPAPATHPYAKGFWQGDCNDGQLTAKVGGNSEKLASYATYHVNLRLTFESSARAQNSTRFWAEACALAGLKSIPSQTQCLT